MINKLQITIIGLTLFSIILLSSTFFTVDQRKISVVFQFGEAVRIIQKPGLNIKIPFVQNVQFLDKRLLHVVVAEKELTASDEKRIIVDAFAKYKIVEPVKFIKTLHHARGANLRLNKILESAIRTVIGKHPLNTLLTKERSNLMNQIRDLVHTEAKDFGVEIVDVRILKSDLPSENSSAIYSRMKTEREKEAKQIRAQGIEAAQRIMASADRESTIIIANANMSAQKVKAMGDKEAARIYNIEYAKDPEFFKFYRSLKAYKTVLKDDNTKFILSPKAKFFKYMQISN